MRGEYVDGRDAKWERDDPRFRVLIFRGPDNAVTAMDIVDATIEEALESARALSNGHEHLWALALVDDLSRRERGLIWLSGMDYTRTPVTARDRQLRRQMQDRYLSARVRDGMPPVLPNGLRLIRVFPEWVHGWPLWENGTGEYHLDAGSLDISPELGSALFDWNDEWQDREYDQPLTDPDGWRRRGIALADRLQRELEGIAEVRPEFLW